MSDLWEETPEALRILAEERAVVQAAELISAGIEATGLRRRDLADKLGISPSELSQRLGGKRNLTLRSLAAMVHELGCELEIRARGAAAQHGHGFYAQSRETSWPSDDMSYASPRGGLRVVRGEKPAA